MNVVVGVSTQIDKISQKQKKSSRFRYLYVLLLRLRLIILIHDRLRGTENFALGHTIFFLFPSEKMLGFTSKT